MLYKNPLWSRLAIALMVVSILLGACATPTTVPPKPTEAPKPTTAPTATEAPKPTTAPTATKAPAATTAPTATKAPEYVTLKDATGALTVDVPSAWKDVDGKVFDLGDAAQPLPSARIMASTNIADFNAYKADGVEIFGSATLSRLGGYLQVLDYARSERMKECKFDNRYPYKDELYEGSYDVLLNCKNIKDQVLLLFAGRPIKNPTSYLVLMTINFTKDGDKAYEQGKIILDTFNVIGNLPK